MKRVLIILLGSICFHAHAQNVEKNLKLVGMVSRDTGISANTQFQLSYQVPTGKIWKIENLLIQLQNAPNYDIATYVTIKINEATIFYNKISQSYNDVNNHPIWLNSEETLTITNLPASTFNTLFNFRLVAFEFIME